MRVTFVGIWSARVAWHALPRSERLAIISKLTAKNTPLIVSKGRVLAFGSDQTSAQNSTRFFAAIEFDSEPSARAYEAALRDANWFSLFDCTIAIGPAGTGFEVMTQHVTL